jgi:molybdopterin/thiamine biosynthesis adenylyltransferase
MIAAPTPDTIGSFDYTEAFSRNLGLISAEEQRVLRGTRVALAGLGGVGGAHATTLARTGIGAFTIADPDRFEWVNANRQAGCTAASIGREKAGVMAEMIHAINPTAAVRAMTAVDADSIDAFLEGVDVVVDGLDFFAVSSRMLLYREARLRRIPVVAAGPIAASAIWQVFTPDGMPWEEFMAMDLAEDDLDRWLLFYLGNAPALLHRGYTDLSNARLDQRQGPSLALAVQLCAGVAAAEVVKLRLGRGPIRPAPWHHQFDAYTQRLARTRLRWGNRGPLQRLRFALIRRHFRKLRAAGEITA